MIVCLCHRISERDIERVARKGCESFEALQAQTCVATRCGTCHEVAQDTFERARGLALNTDEASARGTAVRERDCAHA